MATRDSILSALAYHDIFGYPLTEQEAYNYSTLKTPLNLFHKSLKDLIEQKKIYFKHGYLCLRDREAIVKTRLKRKRSSKLKLKKAKFYAGLLRLIPSVNLVAVSGALAMENSEAADDIDLVIITANGNLWTTRLLANLFLNPYRRKPGEQHTRNKACLNLFLDESNLKIGIHNLYIAHEIAQMRPIWQRGKTYQRFIKANSWVKTFLPNWQRYPDNSFTSYPQINNLYLISWILLRSERLNKLLQLRYMRKRITTEKIGNRQLFFHPSDTQELVLAKYEKRLKKLGNSHKF